MQTQTNTSNPTQPKQAKPKHRKERHLSNAKINNNNAK